MRKYGEDAFTFEILIFIPNILLNIWERFYIRLFNSVKNGYNTFERGNTSFGFKHSEESKKKISLKAMGNQRMVGKKLSEDTKQKISKSLKGFRHSPDTIAKMSKVKMGRYVSDETRLKLKEIMKNRIGKIKYILKSPSGEIVEFLNLKKFCDENNLKIKSIRGIIFGERNSAHGWEFIDKIKN
jgi:group I intron endonuclease